MTELKSSLTNILFNFAEFGDNIGQLKATNMKNLKMIKGTIVLNVKFSTRKKYLMDQGSISKVT